MRGIRRFLFYLRPYKKNFSVFGIFTVFSIIFGTVSLTLVIPFLQIIFDKAVLPTSPPTMDGSIQSVMDSLYYYFGQSAGKTSKQHLLLILCIGVVVLFLLKNLTTYLAMHVLAPIRTGVIRDLRKKMYDNITQLPLGYYTDQRKGDIITKMSADVVEIEWTIMNSFISLVRDPLQILFTIGLLLFFSPQLTLFVLVLLPISAIVINRLGRSLKRSTFKGQKFLSDLMVVIEETLGGIKIMKAFTAEKFLRKKFDERNENFVKQGTSIFRKRGASSPLSEFLASIVIAVVIWFGGNLVLNGGMTAEIFITYIVMFSQLISPAKSFSNSFYNAQTGGVMLDRIEAIVNEPNPIKEKPDAYQKNDFLHTIEFQNVSFQYEVKPVLQNISLHIPKGKTVALVGQSGAGKSTLADLLPRFYDIREGAILLDGRDIRDLSIQSLRSLIGIVPQQSVLFNDSILNNIAFGEDHPDEKKAIVAAKMAHAHDFIMQMEKGYQSSVGEQGGRLSGGQKQRIAIARALYKNAPILILDEATSALDNESEKLVQAALNNLMQDRTSIVIAHRLSTIQNADSIVVLDNGKIAETGTHAQLMANGGVYRKLYELSVADTKQPDRMDV
jgi:subfamily B ATP-binding cassette protein MsbA